jgi:hypothetical protein
MRIAQAGDDSDVSSSMLVQVELTLSSSISFLFITDLPIIAEMTPDPKTCQAPMFAVAGYKDSHHRRELYKRHHLARTIDRVSPQPCTRIHQAENEQASRPTFFRNSNRLPASSLSHAGVEGRAASWRTGAAE